MTIQLIEYLVMLGQALYMETEAVCPTEEGE